MESRIVIDVHMYMGGLLVHRTPMFAAPSTGDLIAYTSDEIKIGGVVESAKHIVDDDGHTVEVHIRWEVIEANIDKK